MNKGKRETRDKNCSTCCEARKSEGAIDQKVRPKSVRTSKPPLFASSFLPSNNGTVDSNSLVLTQLYEMSQPIVVDTFMWPPLEDARTQIRLLHLQPHSSDEDEISAELEVFSKDSAPPFNAISYTWGIAAPEHAIEINGTSMIVRPNCRYALWQARKHFPNTRVWIDAVCINQDNIAEKSDQVAIMGDIYEMAAHVLACVGPADASSDEIKDALADIDAVLQPTPENLFDDEDTEMNSYKDKTLWRPPLGDDYARQICKDFKTFCDREYFRRVWILQELFGGIHRGNCILILCGTYQMDWSGILELDSRTTWVTGALNLWHDTEMSTAVIWRLRNIFALYGSHRFVLGNLISHTQHYDCHDPRDRIFGTLRLTDWMRFNRTPPSPDYHILPFHLAVKVLTSCDRPSLWVAQDLRNILKLNELKPCLAASHAGSETAASINPRQKPRKFWDTFRGASMLDLDTLGRLSSELAGKCHSEAASIPIFEALMRQPNMSDNFNATVATHGFLPVYTSGEVSMLVCSEARPGDIVADSHHGHLVLRKSEKDFSYLIVGQALVVNNPQVGQRNQEASCLCWQQDQMSNYERFYTYYAIRIPDEDALIAVCAHEAILAGSGDTLNILRQHSLGALTKGTFLRDITLSWVGEEKVFGPMQALCSRHRSAEKYRRSGEALMYKVALQAGAIVYVSKGPIRRHEKIDELLHDDDSSLE